MSLLTTSQSFSHKWFHQCIIHKKKLSLRHPLPTFGSFSFFQASLWLGQWGTSKLTKFYTNELRHLFQCCILISRKFRNKIPVFFSTVKPIWTCTVQWGGGRRLCSPHHYLPPEFSDLPTALCSYTVDDKKSF